MSDGVVVLVDGRVKVLQRAGHGDDALLRSLLRAQTRARARRGRPE